MKQDPSDWSARSRELGELLARSGLGDRQAFATLYERTSGHLFAVVLRIQRDAAQSQPLTWLTSIARNRAIDSLRRAQTQPQTVSATREEDDDSPDAVEASADEGPGPLELLDRASEARQLSVCMEGLTPQQRQSVALAFFDGLSHAEVAEHLRQPLGTVKSWVRRALMSLKTCLERAVVRDASVEGA
jgi:RNA polymerase sigma-70 factor (ECF subfamily)